MAIAHRATASATATNTTDDGVTVSKPTGTVDGDVMLAWVTTSTGADITPPAGWTLIDLLYSAGGLDKCYYKVASSEGASYAFTWTDSKGTAIISSYSGVDNADPIFTYVRAHSASNTSTHGLWSPNPMSTDPTEGMLVSFFSLSRGSTTTTQPSGWTLPANGNPDTGGTGSSDTESATAYKSYSGGGISDTSWGTSNGGYGDAIFIVLRQSGNAQQVLMATGAVDTQNTGASSKAVTMPFGYRTGDLLINVVSFRHSTATVSMTGWTQKGSTIRGGAGTPDVSMAVFYKYATSASESGTMTFSTSVPSTSTAFYVRRAGTSGDPFLDYQTVLDTSSNTTSNFPALTVSAQEMLTFCFMARRHDHTGTAQASGYYGIAMDYTPDSTYGPAPFFSRPTNIGSSYTILAAGVKHQSSADPAGGTCTFSGSVESPGIAFAIGLGTASGGARSSVLVAA